MKKEELEKIDEKDIMFITNPGRMGDEDGSNFIVKNENAFTIYRVSGWMYPSANDEITLEEFSKKFPIWMDMWKNKDKESNEKYTYINMGFGNGLSVDNTIYEEYKPYLIDEVNKIKEDQGTSEDNPSFNFIAWKDAFTKMCQDKNYIIIDKKH